MAKTAVTIAPTASTAVQMAVIHAAASTTEGYGIGSAHVLKSGPEDHVNVKRDSAAARGTGAHRGHISARSARSVENR
jgi:hypothetical protein